jgi:hypothetical protein
MSSCAINTNTASASASPCFDLLALPTELKRRTATFLATVDVLRLGETCQNVRQALVLRKLSPVRRWRGNPPEDSTRPPPLLQRCPHSLFVWNPSRAHSLELSVSYQRANCVFPYTCFLFVCAYPRQQPLPPSVVDYGEGEDLSHPINRSSRAGVKIRTPGGTIVAQLHSPTAPPPDQVVLWRTTWTPLDEDFVYYLWCGGAHRMTIGSITLTTRLLDDPTGAVTEQYRQLARLGVLCTAAPTTTTTTTIGSSSSRAVDGGVTSALATAHTFYPNLLLHVARSLRRPPEVARRANTSSSTDDDDNDPDLASRTSRTLPTNTYTNTNSLHTFWTHEAGLATDTTGLAALEEVLQADLDERVWRAHELAAAHRQQVTLLAAAAAAQAAPPPSQAWRFWDAQELFTVREREAVFLVTDVW